MPARPRPNDLAEMGLALSRVSTAVAAGSEPARDDLRVLVKHYLALLAKRAPGRSVEVRVPPFAAAQVIPGSRHTRGTPKAVVETDALTWIGLATGELSWADTVRAGAVRPSGERSDLSPYLPLQTSHGDH